MSNNNNNSVSANASLGGGVGFSGLLTIAFIVLKLCGVIDWPWIWVLSPLWISFCLVLLIIFILFVIAFISSR